jgi:hypothetical protein
MMVINSRGLIHEDSLLDMKIIPKSMHRKFSALKNSFTHVEWKVLGFWLRIYWNDELGQLVSYNKRNVTTKTQQTVRCSNVTDTLGKETIDDEWDKEHIDEIQGITDSFTSTDTL